MPTAPTCELLITAVESSGLPFWQPRTNYHPVDFFEYQDMIIDSNGNYQCVSSSTSDNGMSGATPPTWATAGGSTTTDGTVTWVCVLTCDRFGVPLAYGPGLVQFGKKLTLTWTSTDATSASISNIGTVATSGSGNYTPGSTEFISYDSLQFSPSVIGGPYRGGIITVLNPGAYTLTVTGPGGTATSTVMFGFVSPATTSHIQCFAPVKSAVPSAYGVATALSPAPPSFTPWRPNINYAVGQQVLDSNGNGQVALTAGTSAPLPPLWASSPGVTTTETTGMQWENTGAEYPAQCIQRGFGPLWAGSGGGYSTITYGFDEMVIPSFISGVPAYQTGTAYAPGDTVSVVWGSSYLFHTGIILLQCIQSGTTGGTAPSTFDFPPSWGMKGFVLPDSNFNSGGTPLWKVLGSISMRLNWLGTTIPAPDAYPVAVFGSGPLSQTFDGIVQSDALDYRDASQIHAFIASPGASNASFYADQTASTPPTGVPPTCPTWIVLGIGTAIINEMCASGYEIDTVGAWADFFMPLTPPPPSSNIVIVKQTAPAGAPQVFDFTSSYGVPFSLTDGETNDSGLIPAGTYAVVETPVAGWTTTTSQDPSAIVLLDGETITITFVNSTVPPLPARVLPLLKIPNGQGQSVDELDGQSSIATLDIQSIDPTNELKYLATKPEVVGKMAYFKMGFPGMNLSDFVPLHTVQISDLGRNADGWIRFSCRDNLSLLDRALWFCGGPQPVALPWLYGQAYTAGQYVQDSNGNIQLCVVGGTSSGTQPPVWPGTQAPVWQPNTSYTLGYWAIDNANGNLQQVTTVPSGYTSTRPLNTGVSGNGFPNPSWSSVVGGITPDNSGGNPNGPISWTCIAINNVLGIEVTDNNITWQLVAMPYRGAFGGSQAFYVYNLFGNTVQVPEPPPRTAFTSNQFPTIDGNPRYVYGNPIDILLVALQNELGLGQNPLLPPIVTTDPNDPQNALVFAPNPAWQQYTPGTDATLINPNPFINLPNILFLRDNEVSGRKFEFTIKRPVTAKSWIQDQILKPLGLYMYTHNDGTIDLKSMKSPAAPVTTSIDSNLILGTPNQTRLPIVNVVTVRGDVNDNGAYSAARVYDAEMTFAQKTSLAIYLQEYANSIESNGMREAYDSYGMGYIVADRIFRRHGFATPEYDIELKLGVVRLELGDFILLSHPLMLDYMSSTGQLGIYNVLCEITDRQPNYASGTVKLKVWDARFMNLSQPYDIAPLADAIPDWTSQTPAQKAQYMTIAYWPGWYSDGTKGNIIY